MRYLAVGAHIILAHLREWSIGAYFCNVLFDVARLDLYLFAKENNEKTHDEIFCLLVFIVYIHIIHIFILFSYWALATELFPYTALDT